MPTLVLSVRAGPGRRRLLLALAPDPSQVVVVSPGEATPDPREFDAILIDGPQPSRSVEELAWLRDTVERGASLVAIGAAPAAAGGFWEDLLGAVAGPEPPPAEYYARIAAVSPLTTRIRPEFAISDGFAPLRPADSAQVLVEVRVALRDLPAVVARPLGQGRVLVSGLGNSDTALATPEIAQLLSRGLRQVERGRPFEGTIGVGIIGYGPLGGMGYHHGTAIRATPGVELVAVADKDVDRRKAAQTDFPGIRAYGSTDDLLADLDVELCIVATPPTQHVRLTQALLVAGKHVACEKPLCLTAREADQLIATARRCGRVLTVHHNRRWDPDFVAVRRAVDRGLLGALFNVETFVGGYAHPCRTWHSEVALSGGAVYDWGSHHIDWILDLLGGAPTTVVTHGHKRVWHDVTNLDQLRVRMLWADGREAEFLQSDVAAIRRPKFYIQGTLGTLVGHYRVLSFERIERGRGYVAEQAHHAEAPAELSLCRYESGYGLTETRLPPAPEQPFAFHRNLADHLHLGEPLAVTPESIRRVIAVLEAAHRSSEQGGAPVTPEASDR